MKKIITYSIAAVALFLVSVSPAVAQQIFNQQINVKDANIKQRGDSLYVDMDIDLTNLDLQKNQSVELIPVLENGDQFLKLPMVMVNGKNSQRLYNRSMLLTNDERPGNGIKHVIAGLEGTKNIVSYKEVVVPYSDWMKKASFSMEENLYGRGGYSESVTKDRINANVELEPRFYEVKPQLSYIQPDFETVKARNKQWEIYLNFAVGRSNIVPGFMNNQSELNKMESMLGEIRNDKDVEVSKVELIGYASPEGAVATNERLSKERAEALKNYLISKNFFSSRLYDVRYGGENWDGLVEILKTSSMDHKDEVINIINTTTDVNARKNQIKRLAKGVPYKQMLRDYYPSLRKVIYHAHYTIRNFSPEEGREIIKTRPQNLNLNEMFQVANTYEKGTPQFTEIFETAVRMYPNDKSASLNAGAAVLSRNDLVGAERYLQNADKSTPEYTNNMGVLYLQKGEYAKAREMFSKVASTNAAAKYNLEELDKKIKIERIKM